MKCFICKKEHHFKDCKLYKSKLCRRFLQGNCTREHCFYAHGKDELKKKHQIKKKEIEDDYLKECSTCGDKHYSGICVYLDFL
tara:strand:- start:3359 stop:3607 length:249 start_codon:yes stop_codon:yes gene_type:complete